jgi:SHS2 domain-containing protein
MEHEALDRVKYRILEHTADAMVEVYGKSLGELFANAAYAMFDQITDVKKVRSKGELRIKLSAESREQLLVDYLQELLYVHDTDDLVLGEFEVVTDGRELESVVRGEKFDERRHPKRSVVKGATYHSLKFDEENGRLTILFDV